MMIHHLIKHVYNIIYSIKMNCWNFSLLRVIHYFQTWELISNKKFFFFFFKLIIFNYAFIYPLLTLTVVKICLFHCLNNINLIKQLGFHIN